MCRFTLCSRIKRTILNVVKEKRSLVRTKVQNNKFSFLYLMICVDFGWDKAFERKAKEPRSHKKQICEERTLCSSEKDPLIQVRL